MYISSKSEKHEALHLYSPLSMSTFHRSVWQAESPGSLGPAAGLVFGSKRVSLSIRNFELGIMYSIKQLYTFIVSGFLI